MTTLKLVFDTGMFVLIWIVQLVIYPSFDYYSTKHLNAWHAKYTANFSIIVIPLMIGQLVSTIAQLYEHQNINTILSMLLVIIVWFLTFLIFVPIHTKITADSSDKNLLKKLVAYNWMRTLIWTIILLEHLFPNF